MVQKYSRETLDNFREAAQSLKLYRRAELLTSDGAELVEKLYVDPFPNEHTLKTLTRPQSTFLIGRKGTGKSTVFQRAQFELRKQDDVVTAYVDIKSVYESSVIDEELFHLTQDAEGAMPKASAERLKLTSIFVSSIIRSIREELEKKISNQTVWRRIRRTFDGSREQLFEGLDRLAEHASDVNFESMLGATVSSTRITAGASSSESRAVGVGVAAGATGARLAAGATATGTVSNAMEEESIHTDILLRTFDLRSYISELREVLEASGMRHLYIFLDDFSELPEPSMRVVVDSLVAPLNNWSDELVKFKIAAYPTRIYFGDIDRTKVDEINLDLFSLYGNKDASLMEQKALDFTRRLAVRRFEHFGIESPADFFEGAPEEDMWRQLFFATMANPRNLGWILFFVYEEALLYGKPMTPGSIRAAAKKYYEDKISASFMMNRFLSESFEERSSMFGLKELLDEIVARSRALRRSEALLAKGISGRIPTSHFHLTAGHEALLSTLELNFFVTKYALMKDRDGREITVFALNYGLCQSENIEFGRPEGGREQRYRQYYAERSFDFTPVLDAYVRSNQEIVCVECGAHHDVSQLPALRAYGLLCPTCRNGACEVINLSRKYEEMLRSVDDSSLLPSVELGILQVLEVPDEAPYAQDVAAELDCSYQLVGKRAKKLSERGLVTRKKNERNRPIYRATDLARKIYFDDESSDGADGE